MSSAAAEPIYEEGDRVDQIDMADGEPTGRTGVVQRAFELDGQQLYFVAWDNGMGMTCSSAILRAVSQEDIDAERYAGPPFADVFHHEDGSTR